MGIRCEEFVKNILPTLRKELSMILYEKYKLSQQDIAEKLLITQAAVSQYLNGIRGKSSPEFDEEELNIINKIAEKLYKEKNIKIDKLQKELCEICERRYKGIPCYIKAL
ncbi:MAG: transcriptional regulator [Nanopusillaceae archaeon]|jgi:predicted transcriptional regulator